MNYTLQLHGERMLYPVPSGLYELMSDITREVLRDQPSMLYQYIARYVDTLVRVREYSRVAGQLVDEVTQENVELLSYVSSLGVPYVTADLAARKIQRAFRMYRAKHMIRRAVQERQDQLAIAENLQKLLETYSVDQETADRAASVIQKAFRGFHSKKVLEGRKASRDASTHTIESIPLKPPVKEVRLSQEKKPPKRNSKLLVYQQSTKDSILSSWSLLARDIAEKEKHSLQEFREPKLVYEQADTYSRTSRGKEVLDSVTTRGSLKKPSIVSEDRISLPSYYDDSQPKVPMISESGLLLSDEVTSDIVTLFSADSVDENQRFTRGSLVRLPSLSSLSPTSKPEDLAKELYDIIGNKTSTSKSQLFETLSESFSEDATKTGKEPSAFVRESSAASVRKTTYTDKTS